MELFCECKCIRKNFELINLVVRSDILVKNEALEAVKNQVLEILKKNGEAYVNQFIPSKFGKNEEYILVFTYSIIDKFSVSENKWEEPNSNINLFEIRAKGKALIIKPVSNI